MEDQVYGTSLLVTGVTGGSILLRIWCKRPRKEYQTQGRTQQPTSWRRGIIEQSDIEEIIRQNS